MGTSGGVKLNDLLACYCTRILYGYADLSTVNVNCGVFKARIGKSVSEGEQNVHLALIVPAISNVDILAVEAFVTVSGEVKVSGVILKAYGMRFRKLTGGIYLTEYYSCNSTAKRLTAEICVKNCGCIVYPRKLVGASRHQN